MRRLFKVAIHRFELGLIRMAYGDGNEWTRW